MVLEALGLSYSQRWEDLTFTRFRDAALRNSMSFCELIIHKYTATDIIVLKDPPTGRVLLYVPGNSSPWHSFESEGAAKDWIGQLCKNPTKRRVLEAHFSTADDKDGFFLSGVHTALEGMAAYPQIMNGGTGLWKPRDIVKFGEPLRPWPFSHFRDNAKSRYESDAKQIIHTQSDYRKEEFRRGLTNAVTATGLIVMVAPELLPVLVGLSLALVGTGVDQAIHGRTLEERKEGLDRVEFGVMNALPLAAEVAEEGYNVVREVVGGTGGGEGTGSEWPTWDDPRINEVGDVHDAQAEQEAFDLDAEWDRVTKEAEERRAQAARENQTDAERPQIRDFGPEPPALHSLNPRMRRLLRRLESPQQLDEMGWTTTNGGSKVYSKDSHSHQYIQLHDKVYYVKWVRSERQFRIYSELDENLPGPFVKALKPGEWDLDLKPGLRGGESFDGSHLGPIEDPSILRSQAPETPVILQPNIPKIQVEIPLDGIEQVEGNYFITLNGKRVSVYYDADAEVACWKLNPIDYVWRDGASEWRIGDAAAYKKVKPKLAQGLDYQIYIFPRLPKLPEHPMPIAREVHHVWMGDRLPGDELLVNISKNAEKSSDLTFTLHVDIDKESALDDLSNRFASNPNVRISPLKEEPFYADFLKSKNAQLFNYFRYGDYQNLAAASDVLRYRMIYEYGGIYMDCDDTLLQSFSSVALDAGPSDVLMGGEVNATLFDFVGPNTSHFASHPRNPVLRQLLEEMQLRYLKEDPAFFTTPRPHIDRSTEALRVASKAKMRPYMIRIFELTGPRLFSDVIGELRPDYFDLLRRGEEMQASAVIASAYTERFEAARDFYFPFKRKAPIFAGSANEW